MRIVVTQKDIDEGRKGYQLWFKDPKKVGICDICPLARAFTRAFKKPYQVGMDSYGPTDSANPDFPYKLPEKAYKFRSAFDGKENVKPMHFDI
jgi:hypothetical protein